MKADLDLKREGKRESLSATIRFVSLALAFLTILALGAVAYYTERGIAASRDWVIHTYQVRSQLNDLELEIVRARASEATYLLTHQKDSLPESQEQTGLAHQTVEALRNLTVDNPRQQQRLNQLEQMLNESMALVSGLRDSVGLRTKLSPSELVRREQIATRQAHMDSLVKNMEDDEESLLEERLRDWDYLFKRNVLMLGIGFAIVTIMLAYNFRLLLAEVAHTRDREQRVSENAESYRLMSAKILEMQDQERRRIARELHDSVGQYLAGLKINLSQLTSGKTGPSSDLIRETIELTDFAIQEVRTISHLLHPPLLEELGFLSAARWYVDEYGKRSQVGVSLHIDEPIERLPRDVEIALFRVLQEALTNVYRHASAQRVDVRIQCHEGSVMMIVADDGRGIPNEVLSRFQNGSAAGIGLAGMRERLAEFGGHIIVESSSGGSVVQAIIPTNACGATKQTRYDAA